MEHTDSKFERTARRHVARMGGVARAAKLSRKQRTQIARKGGKAGGRGRKKIIAEIAPLRFEWRVTNYREQHCRVDGRIVGRISRNWDETIYTCSVAPRLRFIGCRKLQDKARALVERVVFVNWKNKRDGTGK